MDELSELRQHWEKLANRVWELPLPNGDKERLIVLTREDLTGYMRSNYTLYRYYKNGRGWQMDIDYDGESLEDCLGVLFAYLITVLGTNSCDFD